jgi:mutator protein MutT
LEGNRAECSSCGFEHYHNPAPTVVVVVEKDNKILVVKRGIEPQKNMWDLPGGFIDVGETVEECVIRETLEETGLKVEIVQELGTTPDEYGQKKTPTLNHLYLVKVVGGKAQPQDDVSELRWVSLDDLPKTFAFKNCKIAIDRYNKFRQKQ